jgi:glycosyltransferase involved in cell wall biosynthesis
MTVLQVDIVVPVRNEERDLAPGVRRLARYLRESFPFSARITIADNGSTDATWAIASQLARELPQVRAARMELPGRGRALRAIWSQSEADEIHYYVGQGSQSFGGGRGSSAIESWVTAHFKKLTVGGQTVHDLTQPTS